MPQPGPQPRPIVPPPPTQGNGFGAGLSQFIEAYQGTQKSKKQEAAANFDKHLALLRQGLPGVDLKQMAKWARVAGIALDYESPAAPQQAPAGAQGGMPPGGGMPPMAGPQQSPPPPPPGGMPQQGPPMQGPPPGMPQGGPPQGGGQGGGGIFSRLGRAMGVPQPPSASQQRGTMQMLEEIKKRGAMSSEMEGMQQNLQRQVLTDTQELLAGLKAGKTMEDPYIMERAQRIQMATKGMLPGQAGDAMGAKMAQAAFPEMMKQVKEQAEQEANQKARADYRKSVATKMDPEQAIASESWVFDKTGKVEAPEFATVDTQKLNEATIKLTADYPGASPEKIKAATLLMFSKDADQADIAKAIKGLGESMTQTRLKIAKQNATLAQQASGRADESLSRTRREDAAKADVKRAVSQILTVTNSDPDVAYDNALNLAYMAFGGDKKKVDEYLGDIKYELKKLSKNPDELTRAIKELLDKEGKDE